MIQGWRGNQEDSHIVQDLGDGNHLFAVMDGHGGPEVSRFVANNFVKALMGCKAYKNKEYGTALENTFVEMDVLLLTENGEKEMRSYMEGNPPDD